jgi:hypothetical protein
MEPSKRNPFINPFVYELEALEPEQKRAMRQILFWVLLVYLQLTWFGMAALPLLIPAALAGGAAFAWRRREGRPTFVALHAGMLAAMVFSLLRDASWIVVADFAIVGALVTLELSHRRPGLLAALAAAHACGLAWSPWSHIAQMNDPAVPHAGAAALFRLFAIVMLVAVLVRLHLVPRLAPPPAPEPEPPPMSKSMSKPMTVAEWEARNPKKTP